MKPVVVIIDDEPQIRKILRITLEASGYKVVEAENANEGIVCAGTAHPNLIILDLGLPDQDGLEVLKEIRSWNSTPIIILSVRNSEEDIVTALDSGANDYLTKPFNTAELLARMRASLRWMQSSDEITFVNGQLTVNFVARVVKKNNEEIKLTNTEYSLLLLFIKNIGKVLTHRYILKEIWGPSYFEQTQYLRVFINQLRKKIEDDASEPKMILTDSGVGYRMRLLSD